jgi:hypothetical protein
LRAAALFARCHREEDRIMRLIDIRHMRI